MERRAAGFRLAKWYLDCVTPEGDATIAYVAELSWRGLAVRYASVLEHAGGETRTRTALRGHREPEERDGVLAWSHEPLGVRGSWRAAAAPVEEPILASDEGRVDWRCLQPAARVALHRRGGEVRGLGYAEHLVMTIPPWRMPIRELHWGRFVAPAAGADGAVDAGATVVWIDWRGEHAARLALLGGARVDADVAEDRVALDGGAVLALDRRDVLREGTVGATVLAAVPRLRDAVPGRILGLHERKWRSRGVLARPGRPAVEGWAIHEVVRWP